MERLRRGRGMRVSISTRIRRYPSYIIDFLVFLVSRWLPSNARAKLTFALDVMINYSRRISVACDMNLYRYLTNSPFKGTDPSGKCFVVEAMILGAILGALLGALVKEYYCEDGWEDTNGTLIMTGIGMIIGIIAFPILLGLAFSYPLMVVLTTIINYVMGSMLYPVILRGGVPGPFGMTLKYICNISK